ncbi:MAG: carbohydrate ABC transporter permease [Clostridiales bacterium]|nr:carbohydrate ABC transporter permease [Clostridiales bacterium]
MNLKSVVSKKIVSLMMGLTGVLICFPVFWLLICSITGKQELALYLNGILAGSGKTSFFLFPSFPTLRGYVEVLLDEPEFYVVFWNSIKLTAWIVAGQMVVAVPAAFGFSRWRGRWSGIVFYLYMLLMLLPFQVTMLSNYLVIDGLGMMDTDFAVILPAIFSTFPVFILYRFFSALPEEVFEAVSLDTSSIFQTFWYVCVPMVKPGITAAVLLGVIEYWNMIEQPLMFLKTPSRWPFSLYMPVMNGSNIPYVFVFSFLVMVPMMVLMALGKDDLENGIGTMISK